MTATTISVQNTSTDPAAIQECGRYNVRMLASQLGMLDDEAFKVSFLGEPFPTQCQLVSEEMIRQGVGIGAGKKGKKASAAAPPARTPVTKKKAAVVQEEDEEEEEEEVEEEEEEEEVEEEEVEEEEEEVDDEEEVEVKVPAKKGVVAKGAPVRTPAKVQTAPAKTAPARSPVTSTRTTAEAPAAGEKGQQVIAVLKGVSSKLTGIQEAMGNVSAVLEVLQATAAGLDSAVSLLTSIALTHASQAMDASPIDLLGSAIDDQPSLAGQIQRFRDGGKKKKAGKA